MKTIYALASPRTGEVRYIGQTSDLQRRCSNHRCLDRNKPKARWLRSLKKGPKVLVLDEVPDDEANAVEAFWIATAVYLGNRLFNCKSPKNYGVL